MSRSRILTVVLGIAAVVCAAVMPAEAQPPKGLQCKNDNTEWGLTILSPTPGATISFVSSTPTLVVKARVDRIAKYACTNPKGPHVVKVEIHGLKGGLAGSGLAHGRSAGRFNSGDVAEIKIPGLKAGPWQFNSYIRDEDAGYDVVKGPAFTFTIKTS